MAQLEDDHKQT